MRQKWIILVNMVIGTADRILFWLSTKIFSRQNATNAVKGLILVDFATSFRNKDLIGQL